MMFREAMKGKPGPKPEGSLGNNIPLIKRAERSNAQRAKGIISPKLSKGTTNTQRARGTMFPKLRKGLTEAMTARIQSVFGTHSATLAEPLKNEIKCGS